ncbi:ATP-binding protein [Chloroflexota bacterium]
MTGQIIGHEWVMELLRRSLAVGKVSHAYLLTGPARIGKTTLALVLAQALNCEEPNPPCGQCRSCIEIAERVHPDVHLIVGTGVADAIKIEQIRALQREAVLAPYRGRYKVFILRQMDQATTEAANSLLKTLEEPPAHVILCLTAVRPEALPSTVVSRCQKLELRPATKDAVEAALLERGLTPSRASLLGHLSGGRVGWAVAASQDDSLMSQRSETLDRFLEILPEPRVARLDFAWKASRNPESVRQQLGLWITWCRDLLLLCAGRENRVVNVDRIGDLRRLAGQVQLHEVQAVLQALNTTGEQLEANVNTRLALEGLFLKIPRWQTRVPDSVG